MADPIACLDCRTYYLADRDALMDACMTVTGGNRETAAWLFRDYIAGYHDSGHDEDYAIKTGKAGKPT